MHILRYTHFIRATLAVATIVLVAGACVSSTEESVPVSLEDGSKINVAVLFDRSGSTEKNGSREGIERAIWPATFFPNLGRAYSLDVMPIGFSTTANAWCDWPDSGEEDRVLSQNMQCKALIENLVNKPVGGNTYFDEALRAAREQLATTSGRNYVLLVTDGEYTHEDGGIRCSETLGTPEIPACQELGAALDQLNNAHVTVCSIFVSTPASKEKSSQTLEWLRNRQNQNDSGSESWTQSNCPASTQIDLKSEPWKLAEDIITWYSEELAGLQVRTTVSDSLGDSTAPITVPNGAAQIAIIGLKKSTNSSVSFDAGECELGASRTFESFYFQPVTTEPKNGERCPKTKITGAGLAPNQNSLLTLFVPERQELAACIPHPDGGGEIQLRPGFSSLLAFKPRAVLVSPKGEIFDPNLRPDQYQEDSLLLDEGQASDVQSRPDWGIAFDYSASVNQPGKGEPYSLLYESTVFRPGTATPYAARRPISPTIDGQACVKLFERNPLQRYWMLFLAGAVLAVFLVLRAIHGITRMDLTGELHVLDITGARTITRHEISGDSPRWFNVGSKAEIEPGKIKDGENWKLRWKKGTNVVLEPESGSTEDWSIGEPKREGARIAIEFRRVPLSGESGSATVRYFPNEGGRLEQKIERALESEEGQ